jgi:hypothetical protein
MLLLVAFLMFAALVVSWLVSPEAGRDEHHAAASVTSPNISADVMASKA